MLLRSNTISLASTQLMKQHKYEAGPCCRKFVGSRRERLLPAGAGLNKHLEITNLVCVCVCVCVCVSRKEQKWCCLHPVSSNTRTKLLHSIKNGYEQVLWGYLILVTAISGYEQRKYDCVYFSRQMIVKRLNASRIH